jgi:gliding motility-associated-like protein
MSRALPNIVLSILLLTYVPSAYATHNRAGEITYRLVSGLTYEFTITTFTYTLSNADRNELEVNWGDNTSSIAPRVSKVTLPNYYYHNTYIATHTFPGPGVYEVEVEDPNRNYGVKNIPNSVNVVFAIKTTLLINPQIGGNSAPQLLNFPIDKAAVGYRFVHNPAAYDPDGDSLSYKLTTCITEGGVPIKNYTLPKASDTLYVDPVTGDLVWDAPVKEWGPGEERAIYNIAMYIEEWRRGVKIGQILRDMQVDVYETSNHPPVNPLLSDICVVAGTKISFEVTSTDIDKDMVSQWDTGGVYQVRQSRPTFVKIDSDSGYVTSRFEWQTVCEHVRNSPYNWILKAKDNNKEINLVDIDAMNIRVIGPPPQNLNTISTNNSILLQWSKYNCNNIKGYVIFRKAGRSGFVPDSCTTGIPGVYGYQKVGETTSWNDTLFMDNNNGQGLRQGNEYCYIVLAVFPDGSYSIASDESCGVLVQGTPVITNVSVLNTDNASGSVYLAWLKPRQLDTIPAPGPYEYIIYRSPGLWGSNFQVIHSFTTTTLDDTTYTDTGLNTLVNPYSYKIELYNNTPGNRFVIGTPGVASTVFLEPEPTDNQLTLHFRKNVPWINTSYVVYRKNALTLNFDSLGVTHDTVYVDTGLVNGRTYCYKAKSLGTYSKPGFPEPLVNFSQENCGIPIDNQPPCPPILSVQSICDSVYNELTWKIPEGKCWEDIVRVNIYYSNRYNSPLSELVTIPNRTDTLYKHYPVESLAGCYTIAAVDSFENESLFSPRTCVDACNYFELPNVFTPNGDGINDFFRPKAYRFVKAVAIKIYNRYGDLVFEDSYQDPQDFRWDGKIRGSDRIVSPGVYYYLCDVWEERLTGIEVRNVVGFVHVYTEKNPKVTNER